MTNFEIAVNMVESLMDVIVNVPCKIVTPKEMPIKNSKGVYASKEEMIYLLENSTLEHAIHEIGHWIHEKQFKDEMFRFDTEGRSAYSKVNHFENFAENFMDTVQKLHKVGNKKVWLKRNEQMKQLMIKVS